MPITRPNDNPDNAAVLALSAMVASQQRTPKAARKHRDMVIRAMTKLASDRHSQATPQTSNAAGELLQRMCTVCGLCETIGLTPPEWQAPPPDNVIRLQIKLGGGR